jgi:hypothetical protein
MGPCDEIHGRLSQRLIFEIDEELLLDNSGVLLIGRHHGSPARVMRVPSLVKITAVIHGFVTPYEQPSSRPVHVAESICLK